MIKASDLEKNQSNISPAICSFFLFHIVSWLHILKAILTTMLIVAASQQYGGQAYSLRSKEAKRLLAGSSTVTPGTGSIEATRMANLPGRGIVVTMGIAGFVNIRTLDIPVRTKLSRSNTPVFSGFF